MASIQHGSLVVDLPPGWSDRSQLLFVAPAASPGDAVEAMTVNFVDVSADQNESPQALLQQQADLLKKTDPTFEVLSQGVFECGLGLGWQFEQITRQDGIAIRQISIACMVGPTAVLATVAAPEQRFMGAKDGLMQILGSLRGVAIR